MTTPSIKQSFDSNGQPQLILQLPSGGLTTVTFPDTATNNTVTFPTNITGELLTTGGAEPSLGNPSTNGQILSSTTSGVRSWINNTGSSYVLPVATESVLGGVKVDGSTITVTFDGVISSSGGGSSIGTTQSGVIYERGSTFISEYTADMVVYANMTTTPATVTGNYTTGSIFLTTIPYTVCTGIRFYAASGHSYTVRLWQYTNQVAALSTVSVGPVDSTGIWTAYLSEDVGLSPFTQYIASIYDLAENYTYITSANPLTLLGTNFWPLNSTTWILNPSIYGSGDAYPTLTAGEEWYPVEPIVIIFG